MSVPCERFTTDSYVHAHELGRVRCVVCGRRYQEHAIKVTPPTLGPLYSSTSAVRGPVSALPEPPAPPEDCCVNEAWAGRMCAYHQGFEDGWEALREVVGR